MTPPPKDTAEGLDSVIAECDRLLEAQGRLLFAKDRYSDEGAETFGVGLLDLFRLHGEKLRAGLAALSGMEDVRRLTREIDVALNGEDGAAQQASLCDIAGQAAAIARQIGPIIPALAAQPQPLAVTDEAVKQATKAYCEFFGEYETGVNTSALRAALTAALPHLTREERK